MVYTQVYGKDVPQNEPLRDRESEMVLNNANGYVFPVDDFTRLNRFLILGSEGGSYYVSEQKLTLDNASAVKRCINQDGERVVDEIVRVVNGIAPKNSPSLFALAMAASFGNDETRRKALNALPKVALSGMSLFEFVDYIDGMRGWGKGLRNAVENWYASKGGVDKVAYQITKYRQYRGKNKWTHRDLMRKIHPTHDNVTGLGALYAWITHGTLPPSEDEDPRYKIIHAYEKANTEDIKVSELVELIHEYGLPWEMVPNSQLKNDKIWEALFENMPMMAMIRNLANLTRHNVITPLSENAKIASEKIQDIEYLHRSRIHPIAVLTALLTYKAGIGIRSNNTWTPVPQISDALDSAFDKSFESAPVTGKRFYIGIDVSASMDSGNMAGVIGLKPRMAAAALAMCIARREENYYIGAFSDGISPRNSRSLEHYDMAEINISAHDNIHNVMQKISKFPIGGTDCALPMIDALKKKIPVDCFIILTDNETWQGKIHPSQALINYRKKMDISAKLIVIAMTSTGFSIADPDDAGMMDIAGFDSSMPQLITNFVSDEPIQFNNTEE